MKPGESKRVTITADPRLLARFDDGAGRWRIAAARYRIAVGKSAEDLALSADTRWDARLFGSWCETTRIGKGATTADLHTDTLMSPWPRRR